jgi:CubicO group peptidase (beta-lactamase class C family)
MTRTRFIDEFEPSSSTTIRNGYDWEFTFPAGGLVSTVGDLAKLMSFQLGHGPEVVLSKEMLLESYELIVPSDGNLIYGDGVGYAAVRNEDSSFVALGHGGALPGYSASYEFDLQSDTGVILLANTSGGRANYKILTRKILALLNQSSRGGNGIPLLERH